MIFIDEQFPIKNRNRTRFNRGDPVMLRDIQLYSEKEAGELIKVPVSTESTRFS